MFYFPCWSLWFLSLLTTSSVRLEATQVPNLWQVPRAHWSGSKSSQFDFLSATEVFEDNKEGRGDGSSVFWLSTRIRACLFVPLILFCWRIVIHFSLEYRVWLPQLARVLGCPAEHPAILITSFSSFFRYHLQQKCWLPFWKFLYPFRLWFVLFIYDALCYKIWSSLNSTDKSENLLCVLKRYFVIFYHQFSKRKSFSEKNVVKAYTMQLIKKKEEHHF